MDNWPKLKTYTGKYLRRVALPLGGIGTGTISLGGRGNLQDWAIMNSPAVGYIPNMTEGMKDIGPFFSLYTETEGKKTLTTLEGPLDSENFEDSEGCRAINHGLPKFRECSFETAYPLAGVKLKDKNIPIEVTLKAFNPLIPGDSDNSGIPVAVLTYQLTNNTDKVVKASVCGNIINCIGSDGRTSEKEWVNTTYTGAMDNKNEYRNTENLSGIYMSSEGVNTNSPAWGTMALTTISEGEISYRTSWANRTWGNSTLDYWDDFSANGLLTNRDSDAPINRMASLAVKQEIRPNETVDVTFLITWHFPNRQTWHPETADIKKGISNNKKNTIGNYYTTQYKDAWDVAKKVEENLAKLEKSTVSFVTAFCDSDLPEQVKEAALFNISTLRTQTCFRTPDGNLYGWEGIHDLLGSCYGSCTHVWNYEQTTAFLFGDLAKTMRNVEFLHAVDDTGHMNFRVELPLNENLKKRGFAAADGQMGTIMKVYREWQLSGDITFLKTLWPNIKKSLEFCWIPGGWDADMDGVMEGCQHNTMDVEYYGPNPQMQGWYLGALRATEEMAKAVADDKFSIKCRTLFDKGSKYMDDKLFNGDYYEHIISVPKTIHPKLTSNMGAKDLENPILQLGSGCLIDQLVGQYMAHVLGLGYLHNKDNVKKTLESIMKYNYKTDFYNHFNHMRSYVLNDESALLMATYPKGRRPEEPFPYYNEVMTGFEHSTAAHMLYEGMEDDGLKVIKSIRDRYDGFKRNPFDEAECGHHYARAMASWAEVLALTGFRYSGVNKEISFAAKEGKFFWSNGYSWGTCSIRKENKEWVSTINVLHGELELKAFNLTGVGQWTGETKTVKEDQTMEIKI
ncbi:MAG: non-lysosomal glucosylceramidase [Spirochaetaceae bacterium]